MMVVAPVGPARQGWLCRQQQWESTSYRIDIYPVVLSCPPEIYTERTKDTELYSYSEDIFKLVPRWGKCINPTQKCAEKL